MRKFIAAVVISWACLGGAALAQTPDLHFLNGVVGDSSATAFVDRLVRASQTGEVIGVGVTIQSTPAQGWSYEFPRTGNVYLTSGSRSVDFPIGGEWVTDHVELTGLYRIKNMSYGYEAEWVDPATFSPGGPPHFVPEIFGGAAR